MRCPYWVCISEDLNSLTRCHNCMCTGCRYKRTVQSETIIHWEMVSKPHLCCEIFRVWTDLSRMARNFGRKVARVGGQQLCQPCWPPVRLFSVLMGNRNLNLNMSAGFDTDKQHNKLNTIILSNVSVFFVFFCDLQWAVCNCQTLHREEYGRWICSQVHQEAPESGKQAWCKKRGDWEGSGHPAAAPAP